MTLSSNFLWQVFVLKVFVYKVGPEIGNAEIPPFGFCSIFGEWDELGIQHLAQIFLIKCYCMFQNASVTAFTVSELLTKNQQGVKLPPLLPTQIRVKRIINWNSYQPKLSSERRNWYLDFLIDLIFQGVNKLFVVSFENQDPQNIIFQK